jgi:hypothetical protein
MANAIASRIAACGFATAASAVITAGTARAGASQAGATIGFGLIFPTATRTGSCDRASANTGGASRAGRTDAGRRTANALMRRFIANIAVVNAGLAADRAKITAGIRVNASLNRLAVLLGDEIFNIKSIRTTGTWDKNIFTRTLIICAKSVSQLY